MLLPSFQSPCASMERLSTARPLSSAQTSQNDCSQRDAFSRIPTEISSCEENYGDSFSILFTHIIFCLLSVTFVTYMAEIFNTYGNTCLYIAKDTPLQYILFERGQCGIFQSGRVSLPSLRYPILTGIW
jgi:hypothetical protein